MQPQERGWPAAARSPAARGPSPSQRATRPSPPPDFSYAGYRYGEVDPPNVPVISTLDPAPGDATQRIQAELDAVGSRPPGTDGFRGALLLRPGRYEIAGTLYVRHTGVVLRGSGDGADDKTNTILVATGDTPHQRTVVVAGSNGSSTWKQGDGTPVTDPFVQVGSRSLDVRNAALFAAGDRVIVRYPSTQAWIDAIDGGGVVKSAKWTAGKMDLSYLRRVTNIDGTRLFLDAPIFNHLDNRLATAMVYQASADPVQRVGVEKLRVDIEAAGGDDENHAWDALGVNGAEDAWVRAVTAVHFGHAGIFTSGSRLVTIMDSVALEPVGVRTGGRFYNLDAERGSQLILFKNCDARGGRHNMITNGAETASGIVFYRIQSSSGSASEGHRHWSQGLLFDNVVDGGTIQLINRGDYGTSHGWGAAHSVIWNDSGTMNVQKPPTAQNYAISSKGRLAYRAIFPGAAGFVEVKAGRLIPESLYEAQLCERLGF